MCCSDNNGLWTSLVLVSQALRYNLTGDHTAHAALHTYFDGLSMLHEITGIRGLIARSAVRPGEATHGGTWRNSTVAGYSGYQWKADASSDEVDGHVFGLSAMVALLSGSDPLRQQAAELLVRLVSYIVENGYYLMDYTGKPTTWGVWAPEVLNQQREWSDNRGLNSLEILAALAAAIGAEPVAERAPPGRREALVSAWADLTSAQNNYQANLLNCKIETPTDDNYSDDELTFLPYYSWLVSALNSTVHPVGDIMGDALRSLVRTYGIVRGGRSDLWGAIWTAVWQKHTPDWGAPGDDTQVQEDVLWNLESWPLEFVEWPVLNSHRLDLHFRAGPDRGGVSHDMNTGRVLPANERPQGRWNGSPFGLDGGSGMDEMDPGVWLLPYWLGRFVGLIQPG